MKRVLLLLVLVTPLMVGCNSTTDTEKLQGKWELSTMAGNFTFDLGPAKGIPIIIFTDDEFTFKSDESHETGITGNFSCDESKSPKQITFKFDSRRVTGIYDISWGRLHICVGKDDKVPPTRFEGGAPQFHTPRPATLVFERAKYK